MYAYLFELTGTGTLCGGSGDYFLNGYVEVACNLNAKSIRIQQQTSNYPLFLGGVGILADETNCHCVASTFDTSLTQNRIL